MQAPPSPAKPPPSPRLSSAPSPQRRGKSPSPGARRTPASPGLSPIFVGLQESILAPLQLGESPLVVAKAAAAAATKAAEATKIAATARSYELKQRAEEAASRMVGGQVAVQSLVRASSSLDGAASSMETMVAAARRSKIAALPMMKSVADIMATRAVELGKGLLAAELESRGSSGSASITSSMSSSAHDLLGGGSAKSSAQKPPHQPTHTRAQSDDMVSRKPCENLLIPDGRRVLRSSSARDLLGGSGGQRIGERIGEPMEEPTAEPIRDAGRQSSVEQTAGEMLRDLTPTRLRDSFSGLRAALTSQGQKLADTVAEGHIRGQTLLDGVRADTTVLSSGGADGAAGSRSHGLTQPVASSSAPVGLAGGEGRPSLKSVINAQLFAQKLGSSPAARAAAAAAEKALGVSFLGGEPAEIAGGAAHPGGVVLAVEAAAAGVLVRATPLSGGAPQNTRAGARGSRWGGTLGGR